MKLTKTERGFEWLGHTAYLDGQTPIRLASQSSAIGDYDDSLDRAGTSYLWIGDHLHLNREEVREFANRLLRWCETGSLCLEGEEISA